MSFWINTKDENGRKITRLIDFPVMFFFAVIIAIPAQLLLLYINKPNILGWHSLGLMITGLVALVLAKSSRFRQNEWFSFGSKNMTKPFKFLYFTAYVLIGIGLIMSILYLIRNM